MWRLLGILVMIGVQALAWGQQSRLGCGQIEQKSDSGMQNRPTAKTAPTVVKGQWIRPTDSEAVIGFADGIRIGLPPTPGPRGLIRIFTPYVFPKDTRGMINFVAVEPIVKGRRGYSEMEQSAVDKTQGKRMWFSDGIDETPDPAHPAQGKLGSIRVGKKKIETLSIVINVEAFGNGAHVSILATFRADRPNEISFKLYAAKDSSAMDSCVLTTTMGNFARTRLLWLRDEVIDSRKLWPDYTGDAFAPPVDYPLDRMLKAKDGTVTVAITPSETDPASVKTHWTYDGKVATQYWR